MTPEISEIFVIECGPARGRNRGYPAEKMTSFADLVTPPPPAKCGWLTGLSGALCGAQL